MESPMGSESKVSKLYVYLVRLGKHIVNSSFRVVSSLTVNSRLTFFANSAGLVPKHNFFIWWLSKFNFIPSLSLFTAKIYKIM